jgi:hypothetical protein
MKIPIRVLIMVVAACLVSAGPVQAGRIFFQAHGGFSSFNLDDVNDSIDVINGMAGGKYLDHISTGWDAGLHVGYVLTAELQLGMGFARLWGSSGLSRGGYLVEYDMPADLYEISLDFLPVSERRIRVGAGATLGMIKSAATLLVTDPEESDRLDSFSGAGFHFAGYAIAEASVARAWSLFGQGGFRHAMINQLKVDGEIVYNPDSVDDKLRFNYSGFFLRLGIKFQP